MLFGMKFRIPDIIKLEGIGPFCGFEYMSMQKNIINDKFYSSFEVNIKKIIDVT